jgi:hypothetical protein
MTQQLHVVSVWLQHPYAGLGDLIRGTMHLYELSQQFNFKLTVDTQFHPVSKYLTVPDQMHETREYVLQNKHQIHHFINSENDGIDRLKSIIQHAMHTGHAEPVLIFTNQHDKLHNIPTAHSRWFIRNLFTPTTEFQAELNEMCLKFKIKPNYSIFHIRIGDDDLVNHRVHIDKYKFTMRVIDSSGELDPSSYIISDSYGFKQFLKQSRPHLAQQIIHTKPIHLSHATETDAEKVHDTLFDFFLLANAKQIKSYTNYTWVSGFVQWTSYAFNLPLVNIRNNFFHNTRRLQNAGTALQLTEPTLQKFGHTKKRTHEPASQFAFSLNAKTNPTVMSPMQQRFRMAIFNKPVIK